MNPELPAAMEEDGLAGAAYGLGAAQCGVRGDDALGRELAGGVVHQILVRTVAASCGVQFQTDSCRVLASSEQVNRLNSKFNSVAGSGGRGLQKFFKFNISKFIISIRRRKHRNHSS